MVKRNATRRLRTSGKSPRVYPRGPLGTQGSIAAATLARSCNAPAHPTPSQVDFPLQSRARVPTVAPNSLPRLIACNGGRAVADTSQLGT